MFLRPATLRDHEAVLRLAGQAGFGMTSLPPDAEVLREKIAASEASFAGTYGKPGQESYFFVLEDDATGQIAGTCGIKAGIGLTQPFYSYKRTTITQACTQLNIFKKHELLQVTNDLTGSTEVGSLFLDPDYRRDRMGKLMSLSRFMFIAAHAARFAPQVIAEMRGVQDADGHSPFYNALARHFFDMPFHKADYVNATQGNQFINDLLPKYPIYIDILPKSAQRVIERVHAGSEPAKAMLERQGFKCTGYVDIFDGGATLVAERDQIGVVRESRVVTLSAIDELPEATPKYMVSNDGLADFRCAAGRVQVAGEGATITPRLAGRVSLKPGDRFRYYPL